MGAINRMDSGLSDDLNTSKTQKQAIASDRATRSFSELQGAGSHLCTRALSAPGDELRPHFSRYHYAAASVSLPPSRPTSSRGPISRRQSSGPASSRTSASFSRSSSFLIRQPSEQYASRPRTSQRRRSSTVTVRNSPFDSGIDVVQNVDACQNLSNFSEFTDHCFRPRPSNHPSFPHSATASSLPRTTLNTSHSSTSALPFPSPPQLIHTYTNFLPASHIDWTLPLTRQKQYDKIDRSCRGLRGLVRRCTTSLKAERRGFYDEKDSDVGTVRRFRMDVDVEGEGKVCGGEMEVQTAGEGDDEKDGDARERKERKSCWSCFRLGGRR